MDDRFLHRGLGTLMVDFSIEAANSIFENYSGCRFIVLDAKQGKESPVPFYEKQRFKVLNVRKGTTPMCLDLLDNIKLSV